MDETARSRAPELDRLVGRNLRKLREELDLSQTDIAEGMAAAGFPVWRKATVADVERGARKVTLDELAGLADVTEHKLESFLAPDADLSTEAERRAKVLTGRLKPRTPDGLEEVSVERAKEKLEAFLCMELGCNVDELSKSCRSMYGHPDVWLERERRVFSQDIPSIENQRQELRARRGHATRAILAEMYERLEAEVREQLESQSRKSRGRSEH
jgi:transcriptional regulator with XRE-family HTH domain